MQPFAAETDHLVADFNLEDVIQFRVISDQDAGARREALLLPVPQASGVIVLHFANQHPIAGAKLAEPPQVARR